MIRILSLVIGLLAIACGNAAAERLEVHTDISRAVITVQNDRFAVSGPPPFVEDLPAGRYRLSVATAGRELGYYTLDVEGGIHLRGGQFSRTLSSVILPGSGQWRDDGWWSGAVTGGAVALMMGRAVYFNAKAGGRQEEADAGDPTTDAGIRAQLDTEELEATRNDYLYLAGGFYIANVLDAAVRRGSVRFTETAPGVVTARYRPAGILPTMLMSAVVPGLGQVRQGSVGRGRVWNTLTVATAYFWAQAQRQVDKARSDVQYYEMTGDASNPGYAANVANLEANVHEQEAVARTAVYLALGIWAYNIADAAFVTRRASADSGEMVRNDGEGPGWTLSPGLVGESAGVVLDLKF